MISSESNRTDSINNNAKSRIIDAHRHASSIFFMLITHITHMLLTVICKTTVFDSHACCMFLGPWEKSSLTYKGRCGAYVDLLPMVSLIDPNVNLTIVFRSTSLEEYFSSRFSSLRKSLSLFRFLLPFLYVFVIGRSFTFSFFLSLSFFVFLLEPLPVTIVRHSKAFTHSPIFNINVSLRCRLFDGQWSNNTMWPLALTLSLIVIQFHEPNPNSNLILITVSLISDPSSRRHRRPDMSNSRWTTIFFAFANFIARYIQG